jgi:coproporphyrinogen III oxidase-like Fe-S oxidoreductase
LPAIFSKNIFKKFGLWARIGKVLRRLTGRDNRKKTVFRDYSVPSKCLCRATAIMVLGHIMGSEAVSLNTVLEYVDKLDIEDQQYIQEIIQRRLIEAKRSAIAIRAKDAKDNVRKNKSRCGTAKDLLADLNG